MPLAALLVGGNPSAAEVLRLVLESMPCGMMTTDSQGRIALVNTQAEKMFGYRREELLGRSMDMLIPERFVEEHHLSHKRYFAQPASRPMGAGQVLYGLRRDGSEFPIEIGLSAFKISEGDFVLSTIADMTERRGLEASLMQSQKMDELGQLASGIAHDFNNLLMGMLGCLSLLEARHVVSEAGKRLITEGKRTVDRGVTLTTRLLAFARQAPISKEAMGLNRLIEEMTDLLARTVGNGCRITMKLSSALWLAYGDRQQIEMALLNLILNARDAMMPQGGTITIATENEFVSSAVDGIAVGEYVVLKVIDTGCGIPPEALSRVVEPFYTTKAPGKGTGLGLSMVQGLMQQLRGGLRIASTVGVGTTMSMYLPRLLPTD